MKIKQLTNRQDLNEAFTIRTKVFVEEQGVPSENEIDEYEDVSEHVVAIDHDKPVATGRVRMEHGVAKLQRICVLKEYRKSGVGRVIVEALEQIAKDKGVLKVKLGAQIHAKTFYEKLGYKQISGEFMDEGIPHVEMVKEL